MKHVGQLLTSSGGKHAAAAFRGASRVRIETLAASGKGRQALSESVRALGIDLNTDLRPKLVRVGGYRFGA